MSSSFNLSMKASIRNEQPWQTSSSTSRVTLTLCALWRHEVKNGARLEAEANNRFLIWSRRGHRVFFAVQMNGSGILKQENDSNVISCVN
jgi:hypothetical protein